MLWPISRDRPQQAGDAPQQPARESGWSLARFILTLAVLAWAFRSFFGQVFYIPSVSMVPTLFARELIALTDAGLTSAEALRAATVDAARLLGRNDLGEIKVGAVADFVVVKGDPLQDITLLQRPEMVVQGGRTVQ